MVTSPPLTEVTTPAGLTVAMYVLLDDQVTVVVAVPVTVAVSPWWRSGVANVYADSLSVMATVAAAGVGRPARVRVGYRAGVQTGVAAGLTGCRLSARRK